MLHGMQKVRGSNPLSSTYFPDLCSIFSDNPSDNDCLCRLGAVVVVFVEDVVHDRRSPADRGDDHVSVDSYGDVGGLVAYGVADVLDRYAVAGHDRDGGVAALVGVPVTDACASVILEKRQLSWSDV